MTRAGQLERKMGIKAEEFNLKNTAGSDVRYFLGEGMSFAMNAAETDA